MAYVGVIFDAGLEEGVEGNLVVAETLEEIREDVKRYVDKHAFNEDDEPIEMEWDGNDYGPQEDLQYGTYTWGRVYTAVPGQVFSFSEFG